MTPEVLKAHTDLVAVLKALKAIDIDILVKYHKVEPLAAEHCRGAVIEIELSLWELRGDPDV